MVRGGYGVILFCKITTIPFFSQYQLLLLGVQEFSSFGSHAFVWEIMNKRLDIILTDTI